MNNRVYLVLIIVLSCALLVAGAGMIGAVLYLQGQAPAVAAFSTPVATDGLVPTVAAGVGLNPGDPAPDFAVTMLDGTTKKLSDFLGKPVVINFWASWCGPCTAEMKNIEAVYQKHLNDDVIILAVNQGEEDKTIQGYKEMWKLNFRLVRNPANDAAHLFHVQALPTTVFVGADGKIKEVHIGGPMSTDFIQQRVDEMLAKK